MQHPPLTPQEKSWIWYDVANSAFVLIVTTTFMPLFFKDYASAGVESHVSTAKWAYTVGGSSLILALVAPILGALADFRGLKKKFWMASIATGMFLTSGLLFVGPGDWVLAMVLFAGASIAWTAANTFYDAFLPDVSSPQNMDRVSTLGFGWGYIGSVVPFLLALGVVFMLGIGPGGQLSPFGMKIGFVIALIWWALFSIPMARKVQQNYGKDAASITPRIAIAGAFGRLFATLRDIRREKPIFTFLMAYFFYIDGVNTIITTATAYGRDLGLSAIFLVILVLFIQVVAWPFAILFGKGARRFGRKPMLFIAIFVYTIVTLVAFLLPTVECMQTKKVLFWGMAFLVASSQGGIQALSRSYYASLIPREKAAEYFGFYDIFGRFAAIMGPMMMGVLTTITGESRWGVLSLLVLFVIGGVLLTRTPSTDTPAP